MIQLGWGRLHRGVGSLWRQLPVVRPACTWAAAVALTAWSMHSRLALLWLGRHQVELSHLPRLERLFTAAVVAASDLPVYPHSLSHQLSLFAPSAACKPGLAHIVGVRSSDAGCRAAACVCVAS